MQPGRCQINWQHLWFHNHEQQALIQKEEEEGEGEESKDLREVATVFKSQAPKLLQVSIPRIILLVHGGAFYINIHLHRLSLT